jgi:hypothetical protein
MHLMHEMFMPDDPVAFVIGIYLNARRELSEPVVVSQAAELVRRALPEVDMSESYLASLIRKKASAEKIAVRE